MARIVPSTLSFNEKRWFTALIKNLQLRSIFLKKRPMFQKNPELVKSWRSSYLEDVAKDYIPTLARPLSMNAIGWYGGEVVFIFLRGRNGLGPVIQQNAFDALQARTDFTPCKDSARPELENAATRNPLASEWNPGHRNDSYNGNEIVLSKHGDANAEPHVVKLAECMWATFQRTLPKRWMMPSMLCPEPFRIGTTGFTRLAVLKSAASAVHTDHANGPGFGCMTTLSTFPRSSGGTFCFVEFGIQIAVTPGDILIANTPAHFHCNIGHIKGLKYSIVAYFKKTLASQTLNNKYRAKTGAKFDTQDEREQRLWDRLKLPRPKHGFGRVGYPLHSPRPYRLWFAFGLR